MIHSRIFVEWCGFVRALTAWAFNKNTVFYTLVRRNMTESYYTPTYEGCEVEFVLEKDDVLLETDASKESWLREFVRDFGKWEHVSRGLSFIYSGLTSQVETKLDTSPIPSFIYEDAYSPKARFSVAVKPEPRMKIDKDQVKSQADNVARFRALITVVKYTREAISRSKLA